MEGPLAFGAVERAQKPTDFDLGTFTPTTQIPATFIPTNEITIEMQNQQPACGAHAGAYVKDIYDGVRTSPAYLWKRIKQIDGMPVASGTSMDAIFSTLQKQGVCSAVLLPNDTNVSLTAYADPSVITPEMDADAATRKTGAYAFQFNPTIDQLKAAIYAHKAVIMLLRVGAEWWTPSWAEKDILPLKTTFPITDGHFVVAYGYDENYIYFYNEWSDAWGRVGIGYFGANYMPRCVEIGTVVDISKYTFATVLEQGMTSTPVGVLQLKLRNLGFFPQTSITSYFGPVTKQAVENFQKAHNLTPDGVVGNLTNAVLNTV